MIAPARRPPLKSAHSSDRPKNPGEELPYRVEVRTSDAARVLARAKSSALARSIFDGACREMPDQNIFLCRGQRVIARRVVRASS